RIGPAASLAPCLVAPRATAPRAEPRGDEPHASPTGETRGRDCVPGRSNHRTWASPMQSSMTKSRNLPQWFSEHFMPLFSERVSMLEVQNRALKKTARERAERIDELERELQHRRELQQAAPEAEQHIGRRLREQLEQAQHVAKLDELQQMSRELERVKAE